MVPSDHVLISLYDAPLGTGLFFSSAIGRYLLAADLLSLHYFAW